MAQTSPGLYVHVPFCRRKCAYCSFYSFAPQGADLARFCAALRSQMHQMAQLPEVRALRFGSLFFGGGTPSVLPAATLAELLTEFRRLYPFTEAEPEITIEVNPGTIDPAGLRLLRRAGCNRLSIGIQSFADRELARLGRIHTAAEARSAITAARHAGFANLSFDLMYGLPGQRLQDWRATLDQALTLAPVHLSMYELTLEAGTPLAAAVEAGDARLPEEDEILAMMAAIDTAMSGNGLARYEISNYAVPGWECRHNCNYWHNGSYLGLGPGAVGTVAGVRYSAVADLGDYCRLVAGGQPVWQDEERLDMEARFRETVVMGLRLLAGVSAAELRQRFGLDLATYYGPVLERLLAQGWLLLHQGQLRLSPTGLPLANRVMAELV